MQTREHSRPSRRHPLAVVVLTLVGAVAAVALFVAPASASSSSVVPEATTPLVPGILGVVIGLVVGLLLGLRLAAQRRPDPVAVRPAAADDQVLAELRKVNERLSVLETPVAGAAFAAQPDPRTTAPFAALPDDVPEAAPTPAPTLATAPPPAPAPAPSVEDDWTPPEPDAVPEWQPTLPDPEPPEPKDAVTVLEEWTGEDRFQTGSHPAVTDEIAETAPADVEAPAALEETQRFVFPDPLTPEPSDSVAAEPDDVPASVPTVEPQIDTPEPSPLIADATWEQPAAAETTPAEPDDVPDTHDVSEPLTSSTGGWQGNAPRAGDLGGGDATDEAAETPEPASRIADWRWGAETAAEDAPTEDPLTTPAWADVTAPVAEEPAAEPVASTESKTETTGEDDPLTSPVWADTTTPAADVPAEESQPAAESTETTAEDAPYEDPLTAPTWSDTTPTAADEPTDEESRIAEWHWGTEAEDVPESPVPTASEEPAAESAPATWAEVSAPSDDPLASQDDADTDATASSADDAAEPANDAPAPWWPTTGTPEAHASADETPEPEAAEPAAEDVDAPTAEAQLTTDDAATIDSVTEESAADAEPAPETDQVEDWRWTPDTTPTDPVVEPAPLSDETADPSATDGAGQEPTQEDAAPASATEADGEESPETPWADVAAPGTEPQIATDPVEDWRATPDDTSTSAVAEPVDEATPEAEDAAPDTEPESATTDQVEDWRWTPEEEVAEETDAVPASPAVAAVVEPTAEMPTVSAASDGGGDPDAPATTEAAHDPLTAPLESLDTDPTEATPLEPPSPANRPPFGSGSAALAEEAPEPATDDVAPHGLEADDDPEPAPPIWAAPHDDDHDEIEEEPDARPLRSRFSSMFDRNRSAEPETEAAPDVADEPQAAAPPAPAYDPLSSEYVVPEEELRSTTPTYHDLEDTISSSVPLYVDPPAEQPVAPAPPAQAAPVDPAGGSLLDDFLADDEEGSHAPRAEPAPGATEATSPDDGHTPDDDPDPDDSPSMWRPSRWIGNN